MGRTLSSMLGSLSMGENPPAKCVALDGSPSEQATCACAATNSAAHTMRRLVVTKILMHCPYVQVEGGAVPDVLHCAATALPCLSRISRACSTCIDLSADGKKALCLD